MIVGISVASRALGCKALRFYSFQGLLRWRLLESKNAGMSHPIRSVLHFKHLAFLLSYLKILFSKFHGFPILLYSGV